MRKIYLKKEILLFLRKKIFHGCRQIMVIIKFTTLQEPLIQAFVVGFLRVECFYAKVRVPCLLHVTHLGGNIFRTSCRITIWLLLKHYHIVLACIYNLLRCVRGKYHVLGCIHLKLLMRFLNIFQLTIICLGRFIVPHRMVH